MSNMKRNACQKCVFAVRDDNPHCGLRGFTTSFNVEWCESENDKVPNGYELQEDGYFSWVNKKKEYPKTYEECWEIIYSDPKFYVDTHLYSDTLGALYKLLICRDAYWKIAGEKMGLGKPWEPDWNNISDKYCIYFVSGHAWSKECQTRQCLFAFPTAEMRDAFKKNFDPDIEFCKELL